MDGGIGAWNAADEVLDRPAGQPPPRLVYKSKYVMNAPYALASAPENRNETFNTGIDTRAILRGDA